MQKWLACIQNIYQNPLYLQPARLTTIMSGMDLGYESRIYDDGQI